MIARSIRVVCIVFFLALSTSSGFHVPITKLKGNAVVDACRDSFQQDDWMLERRKFLTAITSTCAIGTGLGLHPQLTNAAVGTLPEFSDTNAIIQGITVNVADKSQQDAMINFLVNGFDFKVLRKRILDSVEDTVGLYNCAMISM